MSSITGIFVRNDTHVESNDIIKMNNKLSHRGPDGSKIWCEGPIAFGHQMLHTTPESLYETLPFEDEYFDFINCDQVIEHIYKKDIDFHMEELSGKKDFKSKQYANKILTEMFERGIKEEFNVCIDTQTVGRKEYQYLAR